LPTREFAVDEGLLELIGALGRSADDVLNVAIWKSDLR
jgi:hypothetical protein